MDWQIGIVAGIVALAVIYLGRQTWRTWNPRKGACGGGCGCSNKGKPPAQTNGHGTLIPVEQITLRRREPGKQSQN